MELTEYKKNIQDKDYVKSIITVLNPNDNGGQSVYLNVDFFDNGFNNNNIYTNISLSMTCYGTHETKVSFGSLEIKSFLEAFEELQKVYSSLKNLSTFKN